MIFSPRAMRLPSPEGLLGLGEGNRMGFSVSAWGQRKSFKNNSQETQRNQSRVFIELEEVPLGWRENKDGDSIQMYFRIRDLLFLVIF